MRIVPVLLDWRPGYFPNHPAWASLLSTPLGNRPLLCGLHSRLPLVTSEPLIVASPYAHFSTYVAAIHTACARVSAVTTPADLEDVLVSAPGDWLMLVDPQCFPLAPISEGPVLTRLAHSRSAIHLVAMEDNPGGITDRVQFDRHGSVRGIHRYYDARTWMFVSGVACTFIPTSAMMTAREQLVSSRSLADFRRALSASGIPARDVSIGCDTLDLRRERNLLRLMERTIIESADPPTIAETARVDDGARVSGPVVLLADSVVNRNATVIGPAVIGERSEVGAGAVVAQCVIGADVVIPAGTVLAHRVVLGPPDSLDPADYSYHEPRSPDLASAPVAGAGTVYRVFKQLFDRTAALLGLTVLAPVLLLTAILIKLDSRGPVFYAELRETLGGRLFRCWKFRTMRVGAEGEQRTLAAKNQMDGPQFKIHGDPRITRIGRWLRKVSIDELPQFYNVLIGDMSLVGPRPSPFRENQICVPWRQARLSVRAGITGLWQVCREDRRSGDFHQWINYDVMYVRHMSWSVDLRILLATVITFGGARRVPASWVIPHVHDEPGANEESVRARRRAEASV